MPERFPGCCRNSPFTQEEVVMKRICVFIFASMVFFLSSVSMGHAATMILQETFESGPDWSYSQHSLARYPEYLAKNWDIVSTNPHSGLYCAQSKQPCIGGNIIIYSSVFAYSLPTDVSSVFMRFWFKAQKRLNPYKFEFMRFTSVGGKNEIEVGLGFPTGTHITAHVYSPGYSHASDTGWGDPTTATSWTEYAFFIDYKKHTMTFWKDAKAYTNSDPSATEISIPDTAGPYNRVITPVFYKGWETAGSDVYTFWLDDIEIWTDGVPGNSKDAATPSPPQKPSIQIIR
jgi:hypothetical protein